MSARSSMLRDDHDDWHLDKRVPISLILAILGQTVFFTYVGATWKAETDGRLIKVEAEILDNVAIRRRQWDAIQYNEDRAKSLDARLAGLDERTKAIAAQTDRILGLLLKQMEGTR